MWSEGGVMVYMYVRRGRRGVREGVMVYMYVRRGRCGVRERGRG